eukprot:jgi/Phyca11/96983/e_gw1.1.202.1
MQCSALKKNGHVVLNGRPCKIVAMSKGKHAKTHLVGIDIFTGQRHEDVFSPTHMMDVPIVTVIGYQLHDIDDGLLSLSTSDGRTKDDVKLPDGELGEKIQTNFSDGKKLNVSVISAMSEEAVINYNETSYGTS